MRELSLSIFVPIVYLPFPNYFIPILNISSDFGVMGFYVNKVLEYELKEARNLQSYLEYSGGGGIVWIPTSVHQEYDTSKMGMDYDLNADRSESYDTIGQSNNRRKRLSNNLNDEDNEASSRMYNRFTRSVMEEQLASFRGPIDKEDATLASLPRNRTIMLDCVEETSGCLEIKFKVNNLRPGIDPIIIQLNFSMDLTKIGEFYQKFEGQEFWGCNFPKFKIDLLVTYF